MPAPWLTTQSVIRYFDPMATQFVSVKQAYGLSVGSELTLRGWVRSRRDSKGVTFIELNDGSRFKSMQLVVDAGTIADEMLKQITTGSSMAATGTLVESPGKGQAVELKVAAIEHLRQRRSAQLTRCRKKATPWNFSARSPICACAATPSAPRFGCATR